MADLNKLALISPILFDRLMDRLVRAENGQIKHQPDVNIDNSIANKAVETMNAALKTDDSPSVKVKNYNKALKCI